MDKSQPVLSWLSACILLAYSPLTPRESRDSAETYAVYSAILADPPLSHPNDNTRYAIVATTLIANELMGGPKNACTGLSQVKPESLAEIASDFEQHKNTPVRLKRAFVLPKPYLLLTAQQAEEFQQRRSFPKIETDPLSLPRANSYSGASDLMRFSDVYFDRSKRVAMVYVSAWCGGLCGLWG